MKMPTLDPIFRDWVIKKHEELSPEAKQTFLRTIKFFPDQALQVITDNILIWGADASIESDQPVYKDLVNTPREILQVLQEHFAKEMATIAQ